ncbi:MAG: GT4 family glycosyltransferase PelF [Bacilli bacterium]|jgi:glycosyltransferase involved in cell wall biosynthesis|nr:GT4 family glycosyltransferase PelF [Bacilli bacterium]
MTSNNSTDSIDILLVLEGTYPYVRGGVSSWINNIILGFPALKFGVIFLGSTRNDYSQKHYDLASNIVFYREFFLYERQELTGKKKNLTETNINNIQESHKAFNKNNRMHNQFDIEKLKSNFNITHKDFLEHRAIWEYITSTYESIKNKPSFIDYFWTIRGMHEPLWLLSQICSEMPHSSIIHCASTGYAGYLGAMISHSQNSRLIISEHGIYTKERRIDLMLAEWIPDRNALIEQSNTQISHIRSLWIRFFEILAQVAYQQAQFIVNLYGGAQQLQIKDQASPEKLLTIPNGIKVSDFSEYRHSFDDVPAVIALIGRIVPIKDIKTYIRAAHILLKKNSNIIAWIVGPEEEDPEYFLECQLLIEHLQLESQIQFLGYQSTAEILGKIRVSVLCSISEGLPLTILESFAAGVPVVATDVGSCSELIHGRDTDDQSLGSAGYIVDIANPEALASAIFLLLNNSTIWHEMSIIGISRVERYYQQSQMFSAYATLYQI